MSLRRQPLRHGVGQHDLLNDNTLIVVTRQPGETGYDLFPIELDQGGGPETGPRLFLGDMFFPGEMHTPLSLIASLQFGGRGAAGRPDGYPDPADGPVKIESVCSTSTARRGWRFLRGQTHAVLYAAQRSGRREP